MQTRTTWYEIIAPCVLLTIIILAGSGCSRPVGADCEQPFLVVNNALGGSQGQPSISLMNIGDEPVYVSGIGFGLWADDDLTVTPPTGCISLYEDQPEERVLRIICSGDAEIVIPPNEEVIVNIEVQGPWYRLDLTQITATDENGDLVWNDLSGSFDHPFWNNPDL